MCAHVVIIYTVCMDGHVTDKYSVYLRLGSAQCSATITSNPVNTNYMAVHIINGPHWWSLPVPTKVSRDILPEVSQKRTSAWVARHISASFKAMYTSQVVMWMSAFTILACSYGGCHGDTHHYITRSVWLIVTSFWNVVRNDLSYGSLTLGACARVTVSHRVCVCVCLSVCLSPC